MYLAFDFVLGDTKVVNFTVGTCLVVFRREFSETLLLIVKLAEAGALEQSFLCFYFSCSTLFNMQELIHSLTSCSNLYF